ncbi:MAG: CheR family methyltransferase [Bacteroidales bacterium]
MIASEMQAILSIKDFRRLSRFIEKEIGIRMPEVKRIMLQSRLQKRLFALQMKSFSEYLDFVFSANGKEEIICMTDLITTNKTDFFREPDHFEFLTRNVLPQLVNTQTAPVFINCWSAGCSSGEEVYTLAIVLAEYTANFRKFDYHIIGTDISTRMLKKAREGVYSMHAVRMIPLYLKKKYFLKGKNEKAHLVKIVPDLMNKTDFQYLNLMDETYNMPMFDIILCRNVLIYFEKALQERILIKLCSRLKTNGFLLLGHSESVIGFDLPVVQILPTILKKV